jgi:hypothetical protein
VRSLFAALVWWLVLCGLWLLYVGSTTKEVLVAGALAAALSIGVGVALRRLGLLRYGLDGRWLARAATLPWYLVRDFDRDRGLLLMHVLDPKRAKGEPL